MQEFVLEELLHYDVSLIKAFLKAEKDRQYVIYSPKSYDKDTVTNEGIYFDFIYALYSADLLRPWCNQFSYFVPDLFSNTRVFFEIQTTRLKNVSYVLYRSIGALSGEDVDDQVNFLCDAEEYFHHVRLGRIRSFSGGLMEVAKEYMPDDRVGDL